MVTGGRCGTGLACICDEGSKYAQAGDKRINNKAVWAMQEAMGSDTAPGYINGVELTCVHCIQQNTSGALYTRWGNKACPLGHTTVYTGFMATSANHGGGSNYLCLTEKMAGLAKTRAGPYANKTTTIKHATFCYKPACLFLPKPPQEDGSGQV